jgi:pyruvate formate lyase activating enzyme
MSWFAEEAAQGNAMRGQFVRDSLLQEQMAGKMRCNVCQRRCVLGPGARGWCRTRENQQGRLVTLIYGAVSSIAVNPVEKKPFFHFHPGSRNLTSGSWSCNFGCPWCQNWSISKVPPPTEDEFVSPKGFVALAVEEGCQGTSISFNEPTLSLEWSLEVFQEARAHGLYNTFVTNGYMTSEALALLVDAGLDAMNVDVKGSAEAVKRYCKGIDQEGVWASSQSALRAGMHLEITTLVIPDVNDDEATLTEIAARIVRDLGPQVPWHVCSYYPAYRFRAPPTPVSSLERARQLGMEAGLEFVYTGNVPGHRGEDTLCPDCGSTLIRRRGFDVLANRLRNSRCPDCGREIAGIWGEGE